MVTAREVLVPILRRNKTVYSFFRRTWRLLRLLTMMLTGNTRTVILENDMLDGSLLTKMSKDPDFNSVIDDLVAFTNLSEKQIHDRLLKTPQTHFTSEFRWYSPNNNNELLWFYRCNQGYLFDTSTHPYWKKLDFLSPEIGVVLDYGAGIGNSVITLAKRGFEVDYFDINVIQTTFTKFRAYRHGLNNISFISPFVNGNFDPIGCITGTYGAIILQDVLEHIPSYHILLSHLIDHLKLGGYIIETTPFDEAAPDIALHLSPSMPLDEAMKGMRRVETCIWQKTESGN